MNVAVRRCILRNIGCIFVFHATYSIWVRKSCEKENKRASCLLNILHWGNSNILSIPYNTFYELTRSISRREVTMFFTLFIFVIAYIIIASEKFPRHWVA